MGSWTVRWESPSHTATAFVDPFAFARMNPTCAPALFGIRLLRCVCSARSRRSWNVKLPIFVSNDRKTAE